MDIDAARELAHDHLAESLPQRWAHVQAAAASAAQLADELQPRERTLLISATWLHDIGYSPAVRQTGFHPLDGARLLRRLGLDDRLCGLVAHHTAARVEAELRELAVEIDAEFPQEQSQTSDLLWLVDLTTGPTGEAVTVEERLAEIARRYGPEHVVTAAAISATPKLMAAVNRAVGRFPPMRADQSTWAVGAFAIP